MKEVYYYITVYDEEAEEFVGNFIPEETISLEFLVDVFGKSKADPLFYNLREIKSQHFEKMKPYLRGLSTDYKKYSFEVSASYKDGSLPAYVDY